MTIGVLAIQGSVREHVAAITACGQTALQVKTKDQLNLVDGLIIPGGESTTIGKLMAKFGLDKILIKRVKAGLPVYGTCAGAILLAKKISGRQKAQNLGLMDITIERNAYGSQIDSFKVKIPIPALKIDEFPAIFIRAPQIKSVGDKVQVLAKYEKSPVLLQERNILISMFHPELTDRLEIHRYFISMIKKAE